MSLEWRCKAKQTTQIQEKKELNALANSLMHSLPIEHLQDKSDDELLSETLSPSGNPQVYHTRLELLLQEIEENLTTDSTSDIDKIYTMFMATDLVKAMRFTISEESYTSFRGIRNHHAHSGEDTELPETTSLPDIIRCIRDKLGSHVSETTQYPTGTTKNELIAFQ